jgi:cation-transporting ATPase 13A1
MAEFVKVVPPAFQGKAVLAEVQHSSGGVPFFMFQNRKYMFLDGAFRRVKPPVTMQLSAYLSSTGLTSEQVKEATELYGENKFDIPLPTFMELYKERIRSPFCVFQVIVCSM